MAGKETTSTKLTVKPAVEPKFAEKLPEKVATSDGETLELSCKVDSEDAVIVWTKDGRPVRESANVVFGAAGTTRTLTIKNAQPKDAGAYTATLPSKETTTAKLTVKGIILVCVSVCL